ncbi:MAG TPA: FKBP-type peptidyl-prolyl cis-trans isomerase [Chitinophagaceae bacterium]|nr:FKBP-type peptidyl-prolyl cis-trans isomerase [Chitinophagaceae bacterium]
MKNILLGFILLSAVCLSCSKEETCNYNDSAVTASASETTAVENYLTSANITGAQKHPSGFYYKITQAGTGSAVVNLCSNITIKYVGKLTNGTVFDQTTGTETRTFKLGNLIVGWQKGIPLISSGGKITLYLPPSLGYGSAGGGPIPPNSILIFDIELVSVQ